MARLRRHPLIYPIFPGYTGLATPCGEEPPPRNLAFQRDPVAISPIYKIIKVPN